MIPITASGRNVIACKKTKRVTIFFLWNFSINLDETNCAIGFNRAGIADRKPISEFVAPRANAYGAAYEMVVPDA